MPTRPRFLNRPSTVVLALVCFLGAACATIKPPVSREVNIDPETTRGVWQGWGTSLCWWAKVFGDRDDLADWLFTTKTVEINGQTLPGLGMTIARYNAGASSWNEIDGRRMVVSKNILPFRQIESFWLDGKNPDPASASWDWSVDANQRAMLKKARDRGADRFELFSNSPPWWMCANDNPSGAAKDSVQNLEPAHYRDFAVYLAEIARRAKDDWGIAFTTVAPFNEPSASFWYANGKQEGSYIPPSSQAAILPLVRAELDARGLRDLPLSASDESFYDQAVAAWKSFPPEVKAIVSQVNVHGYQGGGGRRDLLHQLAHFDDGKPVWNSEYGDMHADGVNMADNLHLDFHWLRPVAWCYWQPLDGGNKGTGGSGWGLLDANLLKGTIGKANAKAYVFAQYSRHIRPGMTILANDDVNTVVAYDDTARKLVIASFNSDEEPRTIAYDLTRFKGRGGRVSRWLTDPRGAARYERLPDGRLRADRPAWTIPSKGVLTIEIEGVRR